MFITVFPFVKARSQVCNRLGAILYLCFDFILFFKKTKPVWLSLLNRPGEKMVEKIMSKGKKYPPPPFFLFFVQLSRLF